MGPAESALASLKRCRPARPPTYRDGDHYALDPHDAEADLWAFRLSLKQPKTASLRVVRPEAERRPVPWPESPLRVADLEEAWKQGIPSEMSAQRREKPDIMAWGLQPMSNPNRSVGRLSKFEMSGRAWVQEGWHPAFRDGPVSGRARCIWGNVAVEQEADDLRSRL